MWPARIGLLVGLAAQILTAMSHPRAPSSTYAPDFVPIIVGWFLNSSSALIYGGSSQISANISNYGFWPPLLAAIPFAGARAYILLTGDRQKRLLAIVLLFGSTAVWGATLVLNFYKFFDYASY